MRLGMVEGMEDSRVWFMTAPEYWRGCWEECVNEERWESIVVDSEESGNRPQSSQPTTNLGGVTISQRDMAYGGLGNAHDVTMNARGFSKWAVVHELAHAWDGANGWDLSEDMKSNLGAGFDHPILHSLYPNNPTYWYDPGQGPPPAGVDANFNAKEDFAESVAAFVYPGEAITKASNRGWPYTDSSRGYSYCSFLDTPRGQFLYTLMID